MARRSNTVVDLAPAGQNVSARRRQAAAAVIVAVAACVVYANSLADGFAYDDETIILGNPAVVEETDGHFVPWYEAWRHPYWPNSNEREGADVLYRPLTIQTFAWDMRFLGPAAWWFHFVNIVLHAVNSVGVWWIAKRLIDRRGAALAAGLLFAVHPIHTEAVTSIVGRAELLAASGILLAVIATDVGLTSKRTAGRIGGSLLAIAAAAIAIFSKEGGVAVIPTVVAWAWWRNRQTTAGKRTWRQAALILVVIIAIFGGYLAARHVVCGGRFRLTGQLSGPGNVLRDMTGAPRYLTWVALIGRYTALMFWPQRLLADYSYAVIEPTHSPIGPYFLLGLLTVGAMIAGSVQSVRRGHGAAAVCTIGWAASYVLVSNSVILIAVIFAERWYYAPSIWFVLLLVMAAERVLQRVRMRAVHAAASVALCSAVVALGARTWIRNPDWASTIHLIEHDVGEMKPGHRSAHFSSVLAQVYLLQHRLDDAEKLARSAVQAVPENAALRVTLARVLLAENRTDEALAELREAQRIDPKSATAGAMLEQARLQAQGIDTAKSRAKALAYLRAHPDDAEAAYAAGYFSEALGFFASAARYYAQAAELDPQHHQAMLGWARSLASADEPAQAVAVYKQILERWPDDWQAHTNLAVLLMLPQRGELYQPKQAIQHAERALALAPDHVKQKVTLNLAEVCGHVGQTQRAIKLFEKVRDQLPPDDPQRQRLQSRIDYFKQQK